MRLGVIDVGSNTVHLLVVDAHTGGHPLPAYSHKTNLQLAAGLAADGTITDRAAEDLTAFIGECLEVAQDQGVGDLFGFATSAIRDAPNGDEVLEKVRSETGVDLQVMSGRDEARETFLAVRRWFGWSSGRLLVIDIGGGSLELAAGVDEEPDAALSLPLGAGRLTRFYLTEEVPDPVAIQSLRREIRAVLGRDLRPILKTGAPDRAVGTSKTMRSLARIAGAAPSADGPYVPRRLALTDLDEVVEKLAERTPAQRAQLPGVSVDRAPQLLAGALVAQSAMELLKIDHLDICPWALREGMILRRFDHMPLS